ncbi:MAG: NnrS family protein [Pseudomonadota bacterium]
MPALILSYGFRPLFLCVVAVALILIPWWIAIFFGAVPYLGPLPVISWHGHEMIFGFAGAAIGGFLLTAVANWTGRPPISGLPLAFIVTSWLLTRVAFAVDLGLTPGWLALMDCAYWFILTTLVGREILLARNYRNLKVVLILGCFLALTLAFHLGGPAVDWQRALLRCALILTSLLITLIGGRIIPAFTTNWLRANRPMTTLPGNIRALEAATFTFTLMLVGCWTIMPEDTLTGAVAVVAGLLQLARLCFWQGHRTLAEPLLFALHAGYAWLGIGFLLIGLTALGAVPLTSAGVHALGAGAMAAMIMAVASRAAMGHTGRRLAAGPLLATSFLLVHAAALLRVGASFNPQFLIWSALAWSLAFVSFAIPMLPILVRPAR